MWGDSLSPGSSTGWKRRGGGLWSLVAGLGRLDWAVLVPVLMLMMTGLLLIHTTTSGVEDLLGRQLRWYVIGLGLSIPAMLIPYTRMLRFAPALYVVGLVALFLVLTTAPVVKGSRRWFVISGQQVQPSEFMKLFTVLVLARLLRFGRVLDRPKAWIVPLVVAVLPAAFIVVQPDLGTSLLFGPLAFAVVLVSGIPLRSLLLLATLGVVLVGGAYEFALEDYQKERIWSTYNHDRLTSVQRAGPGFQLTQSLLAISGGGFLGQGFGQGAQTQADLLPLDYNDFIFAVHAEELGFLGCLFLIFLYVVLVLAIYRVALNTRDPAGRLICVGIGTILGFQSLVHMAVTLGLAPTTGMTLPLVSYGGSSFLMTTISLALVQNVAINRPRTPMSPLGRRAPGDSGVFDLW